MHDKVLVSIVAANVLGLQHWRLKLIRIESPLQRKDSCEMILQLWSKFWYLIRWSLYWKWNPVHNIMPYWSTLYWIYSIFPLIYFLRTPSHLAIPFVPQLPYSNSPIRQVAIDSGSRMSRHGTTEYNYKSHLLPPMCGSRNCKPSNMVHYY